MKYFLVTALLFPLVAAADPITAGTGCASQTQHTAAADVNYQPGSTAGGVQVAAADIAASTPAINQETIYARLPMADYISTQGKSADAQAAINSSDIFLGEINVQGNAATLDGQALTSQASSLSTDCPH